MRQTPDDIMWAWFNLLPETRKAATRRLLERGRLELDEDMKLVPVPMADWPKVYGEEHRK